MYAVVVTVTDDDGGAGMAGVERDVNNLAPTVTLDVSDAIDFPGGNYFVVEAGGTLPLSAGGTDPGSDDLTFTWSVGDVNTYFNDGATPDLPLSPLGTFPFAADDSIDAVFPDAAFVQLQLTLSDDDGGASDAEGGAIVTGIADTTEGDGWWQHQYAGTGSPQLDDDTPLAYLGHRQRGVQRVLRGCTAATLEDAHAILSPPGGDRRARASAALLVAWLHFASGAVGWDATVPLGGGRRCRSST